MKQYTRKQVIKRLKDRIAKGYGIVAAGAGTGISAKFEEEGGADLILVFNSGLYRMHGLGSLSGWMAYGNANDVSLELGEKHILPIVKEAPVICSVNGTDPTKVMESFLWKIGEAGFSGINNFPTIGMIDGKFRAALEETGMGYDKEVEMIALAHEMGFFTTAYVFNPEEARQMAKAGCDCILAHMGLTVGGAIGAKETMSLQEAAEQTEKIESDEGDNAEPPQSRSPIPSPQFKGRGKGLFSEGEFSRYIVLDPMIIPPFDGVDIKAAHHDGKMEVISSCQAGVTREPQGGSFSDLLSKGNLYFAQVSVNRRQALSVVEHDGETVDSKPICVDNSAMIGCLHRGVG